MARCTSSPLTVTASSSSATPSAWTLPTPVAARRCGPAQVASRRHPGVGCGLRDTRRCSASTESCTAILVAGHVTLHPPCDPAQNLEILASLRRELTRAGHLRAPHVFLHPSLPAEDRQRLQRIVEQLHGEGAASERAQSSRTGQMMLHVTHAHACANTKSIPQGRRA